MKKYKVTITETLEKEVVVTAKSLDDAIKKVRDDYRDEVHVLDSDNWTDTSYSATPLEREREYER